MRFNHFCSSIITLPKNTRIKTAPVNSKHPTFNIQPPTSLPFSSPTVNVDLLWIQTTVDIPQIKIDGTTTREIQIHSDSLVLKTQRFGFLSLSLLSLTHTDTTSHLTRFSFLSLSPLSVCVVFVLYAVLRMI